MHRTQPDTPTTDARSGDSLDRDTLIAPADAIDGVRSTDRGSPDRTECDEGADEEATAHIPRRRPYLAVHDGGGSHTVNAVFAAIADALGQGETVTIAGFGTFSTRSRPERPDRNQRTRERIAIAASRTPAFKAGKNVRDAVR